MSHTNARYRSEENSPAVALSTFYVLIDELFIAQIFRMFSTDKMCCSPGLSASVVALFASSQERVAGGAGLGHRARLLGRSGWSRLV